MINNRPKPTPQKPKIYHGTEKQPKNLSRKHEITKTRKIGESILRESLDADPPASPVRLACLAGGRA